MSSKFKITLFGIASGLIWSLIAILLHAQFLFSPHASIFVALLIGGITGVAVSFSLKAPLTKLGKWGSAILGLLAFPLGTFIFAFLFALFEMMFGGTIDFNLSEPFIAGFFTAYLSAIYGFYLFPVAVLTTFILRMVIRSGNNNLSLKH
ncbi:MAG TPA: hypothetical protein VE344_00630 [Methylomirabilota bacterium]|nr:hypothetical protein [Methylomirabilota bacterium]